MSKKKPKKPKKSGPLAGRKHPPDCAHCAALKANTRHGHAVRGGESRAYSVWRGMLSRVLNPKRAHYDLYGGRGITVCDRWRSFELFLSDMGEPGAGMSLDRVDNDGPYAPGNCRWASSKQQRANRRPIAPEKVGTVYREKGSDSWRARYRGRRLGSFETEAEARAAIERQRADDILTLAHLRLLREADIPADVKRVVKLALEDLIKAGVS